MARRSTRTTTGGGSTSNEPTTTTRGRGRGGRGGRGRGGVVKADHHTQQKSPPPQLVQPPARGGGGGRNSRNVRSKSSTVTTAIELDVVDYARRCAAAGGDPLLMQLNDFRSIKEKKTNVVDEEKVDGEEDSFEPIPIAIVKKSKKVTDKTSKTNEVITIEDEDNENDQQKVIINTVTENDNNNQQQTSNKLEEEIVNSHKNDESVIKKTKEDEDENEALQYPSSSLPLLATTATTSNMMAHNLFHFIEEDKFSPIRHLKMNYLPKSRQVHRHNYLTAARNNYRYYGELSDDEDDDDDDDCHSGVVTEEEEGEVDTASTSSLNSTPTRALKNRNINRQTITQTRLFPPPMLPPSSLPVTSQNVPIPFHSNTNSNAISLNAQKGLKRLLEQFEMEFEANDNEEEVAEEDEEEEENDDNSQRKEDSSLVYDCSTDQEEIELKEEKIENNQINVNEIGDISSKDASTNSSTVSPSLSFETSSKTPTPPLPQSFSPEKKTNGVMDDSQDIWDDDIEDDLLQSLVAEVDKQQNKSRDMMTSTSTTSTTTATLSTSITTTMTLITASTSTTTVSRLTTTQQPQQPRVSLSHRLLPNQQSTPIPSTSRAISKLAPSNMITSTPAKSTNTFLKGSIRRPISNTISSPSLLLNDTNDDLELMALLDGDDDYGGEGNGDLKKQKKETNSPKDSNKISVKNDTKEIDDTMSMLMADDDDENLEELMISMIEPLAGDGPLSTIVTTNNCGNNNDKNMANVNLSIVGGGGGSTLAAPIDRQLPSSSCTMKLRLKRPSLMKNSFTMMKLLTMEEIRTLLDFGVCNDNKKPPP